MEAPVSAPAPAPAPAPVVGKQLDAPPPALRELDLLCPRPPKVIKPFEGSLEAAHKNALTVARAAATAALLTFVGENKLRFVTCSMDFEPGDDRDCGAAEFTTRFVLRPATLEELAEEDVEDAAAMEAFVKSRLDELWEEAEKKDGEEKRTQAVRAYKDACDVEVKSIERLLALESGAARAEAFERAKNLEAAIKQRCDTIPWFKTKFEALLPDKDKDMPALEAVEASAAAPAAAAASASAAEASTPATTETP